MLAEPLYSEKSLLVLKIYSGKLLLQSQVTSGVIQVVLYSLNVF